MILPRINQHGSSYTCSFIIYVLVSNAICWLNNLISNSRVKDKFLSYEDI